MCDPTAPGGSGPRPPRKRGRVCPEAQRAWARACRRRVSIPPREAERVSSYAAIWRHGCLAIAVVLAVCLASARARASLPTCVRVLAAPQEVDGLRRLVETELDRHPTHRRTEHGCTARLSVELLSAGGELVLTARVDGEVPYRVGVEPGKLMVAVDQALRVVLHSDPRVLQGPMQRGWFGDRIEEFRIHGQNYYGLELAQTFVLVGGRLQSLGGAGLTVRREVGAFSLGARVTGSSTFSAATHDVMLTEQFLAHLELALYSDTQASTALFGAFTAGLELQRFQGVSPWSDEPEIMSARKAGLSAGLRGGAEFFRLHDMRAQVFAQILVPAFVSRDADNGIVDQWTPSAALGFAAAF